MNSNFIYPFETVQHSNVFLVPLLDIPHPIKTYLYIAYKNIVIDDYFVAVYNIKGINNKEKIIGNKAFLCDIEYNNSYIALFKKEDMPEDIKKTLALILTNIDGKIYSYYSKFDYNIKKKILAYYKNFSNDDRYNFAILKMLNRYFFPKNHLSSLAEALSYNDTNDNILYEINKIGEYGPAVSLPVETMTVNEELFTIITDAIKNSVNIL